MTKEISDKPQVTNLATFSAKIVCLNINRQPYIDHAADEIESAIYEFCRDNGWPALVYVNPVASFDMLKGKRDVDA